MRSLYLLIDGLTIAVPVVASFSPRIRFFRVFWPFLGASVCVAVLFMAWDVLYTYLGVWGFNPRYVAGLYFLYLPIEEMLFFFCIPFACVFTYYCLDRFKLLLRVRATSDITEMVIVGALVAIAADFHTRLYTSAAFVSAAFACLVVQLIGGGKLVGRCFATYLVLLVPFFLVNGVLTGTGLAEPIVWYNNSQILGVRLLTIPVEDIFYGFSLVSLNIAGFELFSGRIGVRASGRGS